MRKQKFVLRVLLAGSISLMVPSNCYAKYDWVDAVGYASKYAKTPNREYHDFTKNGDCTNFTSQCLKAGGVKRDGKKSYIYSYMDIKSDNKKWYYYGGKTFFKATTAWTTVSGFYTYSKNETNSYIKSNLSETSGASYCKVGDIITIGHITSGNKVKYTHNIICVGKHNGTNNSGKVYCSAHSNNYDADALSRFVDRSENQYGKGKIRLRITRYK